MDSLAKRIVDAFSQLPGRKALKVYAPGGQLPLFSGVAPPCPKLLAELNPDREPFCGSAFKAYVLAEFLRQMESGETQLNDLLPVDSCV